MAVPAGPTDKRYTGNGVTKIFTIPFLLLAADDLAVFINGIEITSGFVITGTGSPTSTIVFTVAPASLADIYLQLDVPFQRLNDYQENGDFLASTVNRDFDRIWQALKQLLGYSRRALTLGSTDVDGAGAYRAKGNRISDLGDPVFLQDAATKNWAQQYVGSIIGSGQGSINVAANVIYQGPDGAAYNLQQLSGPIGSDLVGHSNWQGAATTVGKGLRLVTSGTVYADDPRFGGNIVAAAVAVGDNTVFIIRQPHTLTEPLRLIGKTGVLVCCVGAGKLSGSRTAFTFPTANARGILHFDNCINPVAYRMNILGARTARPSDPLQDGDAGIEFYQCSGLIKSIENKVEQVMTWGIIHIQCSAVETISNRLTNMTRQSGIGHATVGSAVCRNNYIRYSGLYGIEIEGVNTNVEISGNQVSNCLAGIESIASGNSVSIKNNFVYLCTYGLGASANGAGNNQVGIEISGNRTYDNYFHFYINDATFVEVFSNSSLGRVSGAFIPQRQADHVVSVINSTAVLVLDSSTGTILVGDVQLYTEGIARTVSSVSVQVDAIYGSCWKVTYASPDSNIVAGSFFMRSTNFVGGSTNWFYLTGTRNSNINIWGNSINAPAGRGLDLNGGVNSLRWSRNLMVGGGVAYYAGDSTGITNSSIVIKKGDIQQPSTSMFGGAAQQKILPSLTGEIRTANMSSPNKPINLTTTGTSIAFRLKVSVYGSTKTGSTGNAQISVNGALVDTIPVATIGTTLISRDIALNISATSYTLNIADTFGDMGFASASFELHTIES